MAIRNGPGYNFNTTNSQSSLSIDKDFTDWYDGASKTHPFKVIAIGPSGSAYRYKVVSGTENNLVPVMYDVISAQNQFLDRTTSGVSDPPIGELSINTSTFESWIYLRAGKSASTGIFPDDDALNPEYPLVMSSNLLLTDSDAYGYVLIGKFIMDSATSPTTGSLSQYVTGSLWGDRIKLGTLTASYYYARI